MKPRQNPFRADVVTALPFVFAGRDFESLWRKLHNQNGRGAIVGPCGSGKTTFLDAFERELERREFAVLRLEFRSESRRLPRDWNRRFCAPKPAALLVDGYEQLGAFDAWKLCRAARSFSVFVATSHRNLPLPLWFETTTSPQLLEQLCHDLGAPILGAQAEALWHKHGGNVRLALRELYDFYGTGAPLKNRENKKGS